MKLTYETIACYRTKEKSTILCAGICEDNILHIYSAFSEKLTIKENAQTLINLAKEHNRENSSIWDVATRIYINKHESFKSALEGYCDGEIDFFELETDQRKDELRDTFESLAAQGQIDISKVDIENLGDDGLKAMQILIIVLTPQLFKDASYKPVSDINIGTESSSAKLSRLMEFY